MANAVKTDLTVRLKKPTEDGTVHFKFALGPHHV